MKKKKAKPARADTNSKLIAELTSAIEEVVSDSKKLQELEGIMATAKLLAQDWKIKKPDGYKRPLFDNIERPTTLLLAALAVALRRDHKLLERIREHYPGELENLVEASWVTEGRRLGKFLASTGDSKLTPKQRSERKRRLAGWGGGEIERVFGGVPEAPILLSKPPKVAPGSTNPLLKLLPGMVCGPPLIFDKILAGGAVSRVELQNLFGMDHKQFPENLPFVKDSTKRLYDYHAVVVILEFLLSERPQKRRKKSRPGRPRKDRWYRDPDGRIRVLSRIEARLNGPCVPKHIATAFLDVVRRYRCRFGD